MAEILSETDTPELPGLGPNEVRLQRGMEVTHQYARAEFFYLLIDGSVSHHINLEQEQSLFCVTSTSEKYSPVGWSGFSAPHRYATTVIVVSKEAWFYRWRIDDLNDTFRKFPGKGQQFLKLIGRNARKLVADTLDTYLQLPENLPVNSIQNTFQKNNNPVVEDTDPDLQYLRQSPFFEVFDDEVLLDLSLEIERKPYRAGDIIFAQGEQSPGLLIIEQGWVDFFYKQRLGESETLFRSISTTGFVVSWSGMLDAVNLSTAIARRETILFHISIESINKYCDVNPDFGLLFIRRVLWLISHQLQVVRSRLISIKFNLESVAVRSLIDQNSTRLSLNSPLHKIPHLLENKLSHEDAFQILHQLHEVGDSHERHIASLCLDNLQEIWRESQFYDGLIKTYQRVVSCPDHIPKKEVRKACAKSFREAFSNVKYSIEGWQNLPDAGGNIFIYNHLRNHPHNTLPNNFQVTLDSHFISSNVLFEKYGDPGLRVVRIGKGIEYGHQEYYEKLGHIDVYTSESEENLASHHKEEKRQAFYHQAGKLLEKGQNILISPEGTSYATEESPGPFRSGAFRLALSQSEEPWIVPIIVVRFDKRVRNNLFKCVIKPPIRISDYIKDPMDKMQMQAFLIEYQQKYRDYILEALN